MDVWTDNLPQSDDICHADLVFENIWGGNDVDILISEVNVC